MKQDGMDLRRCFGLHGVQSVHGGPASCPGSGASG